MLESLASKYIKSTSPVRLLLTQAARTTWAQALGAFCLGVDGTSASSCSAPLRQRWDFRSLRSSRTIMLQAPIAYLGILFVKATLSSPQPPDHATTQPYPSEGWGVPGYPEYPTIWCHFIVGPKACLRRPQPSWSNQQSNRLRSAAAETRDLEHHYPPTPKQKKKKKKKKKKKRNKKNKCIRNHTSRFKCVGFYGNIRLASVHCYGLQQSASRGHQKDSLSQLSIQVSVALTFFLGI